jgi:hypothetical protein
MLSEKDRVRWASIIVASQSDCRRSEPRAVRNSPASDALRPTLFETLD